MEYLVEVQWTDPTAGTVAHILSTLPEEVEKATGHWPEATSRAFCVLRAPDSHALDKILSAITQAGANARVITGAEAEASRR